MAIARSTRETFDYVLEADRGLPPDQQTVFHLRRLSQAHQLAIENLTTIDQKLSAVSLRSGDQKLLALRAGLVGWSNFRDEGGAEIPFRADDGKRAVLGISVDGPASLESLERLQTSDAREIANAIIAGNQLTRADAKN